MPYRHFHSEIFEDDLHAHLRNPDASFKLACWDMARAGRDIPEERDFMRQVAGSTRANAMILRLLPDGDLLYEFFGETIARHAGYDMSMRRLSDFKGEMLHAHKALYDRAIHERRAFASLHRIGSYMERPLWERVIMPVADGGVVTALHVVNSVRELEHDLSVLQARHRDCGMIALQFRRDERGDISEALIAGANREAMKLTGRRLDEMLGLSMTACFPGIVKEGLWDRYLVVARDRETQSFEQPYRADGMDGVFAVTLVPFHDGVIIEFTLRSGP